jgi:hypothetical protein
METVLLEKLFAKTTGDLGLPYSLAAMNLVLDRH